MCILGMLVFLEGNVFFFARSHRFATCARTRNKENNQHALMAVLIFARENAKINAIFYEIMLLYAENAIFRLPH